MTIDQYMDHLSNLRAASTDHTTMSADDLADLQALEARNTNQEEESKKNQDPTLDVSLGLLKIKNNDGTASTINTSLAVLEPVNVGSNSNSSEKRPKPKKRSKSKSSEESNSEEDRHDQDLKHALQTHNWEQQMASLLYELNVGDFKTNGTKFEDVDVRVMLDYCEQLVPSLHKRYIVDRRKYPELTPSMVAYHLHNPQPPCTVNSANIGKGDHSAR